MAINLRRLRAGEMPSPSEWNRLVELVEQLTRVSGSGDTEISLSQTGIQVYDNRPNEHWARIIRRPDSHEDGESPIGNKYAHVQVDVDEDGTATDLPAASGFIWGEPDYLPAIEVNESGDVPDGQVVRLVPSRVGPWFEFDASGGGGAGIEWFRCTSETVDGDGRYPGRYDTYDPDADTWTTGDLVALEVAEGVFLKEGMRYRGKPTSDPGVFTVTGGASYNTDDDEYRSGFVEVADQYWTGDKYLEGAWISYPAPPGKDIGGEYTARMEGTYSQAKVNLSGNGTANMVVTNGTAFANVSSVLGANAEISAAGSFARLLLTETDSINNSIIGTSDSAITTFNVIHGSYGVKMYCNSIISQVFGFWNWSNSSPFNPSEETRVYHHGDILLARWTSLTDSQPMANSYAFGVFRNVLGSVSLERGVDTNLRVRLVDQFGADAGGATLRIRGGLITGVGGLAQQQPMPAFSGNNHISLDDDYLAYQDEEIITDTLRSLLSGSQKITGEAPPPPPPPPP